jgi:hypothetical protein
MTVIGFGIITSISQNGIEKNVMQRLIQQGHESVDVPTITRRT